MGGGQSENSAPKAKHYRDRWTDVHEDDPYEELPLVEAKARLNLMQQHQRKLAKERGQVDEEHLRETRSHEVVLCRQDGGTKAAH